MAIDLSSVPLVLQGLKNLLAIGKTLSDDEKASSELVTQLNNQIIDLQQHVAEMQINLMSLNAEHLGALDKIRELEEAAKLRNETLQKYHAVWLVKEGQLEGPYCQACFSDGQKLTPMQSDDNGTTYQCAHWNGDKCKCYTEAVPQQYYSLIVKGKTIPNE